MTANFIMIDGGDTPYTPGASFVFSPPPGNHQVSYESQGGYYIDNAANTIYYNSANQVQIVVIKYKK